MPDERDRWVTFDRWDAEHARLKDRLDMLEYRVTHIEAADEQRRARQWMLVLALITSLAMPLAVAAIIAWSASGR